MRIFTCRPDTKYAGEHYLYESIEEFEKEYPGMKVYKWAIDNCIDAVAGDWVRAEDGYIVRILQKYKIGKDKPNPTWMFRFPMGTFGVYVRISGVAKYPKFYAQFTNGDLGSLSGKTQTSRVNDYSKIRWANLVVAGMPPEKALKMCFQGTRRLLTAYQVQGKILRLLKDKVVQMEIQTQVKAFKDQVAEKIPLESVITKIKDHWDNLPKGTATERESIKWILELHDVLVVDETTGKKKIANKSIEEADYTEESAPLLGKATN